MTAYEHQLQQQFSAAQLRHDQEWEPEDWELEDRRARREEEKADNEERIEK